MKKTLISALAIMLALSAFTACGGDDSTSYDDSADAENAAEVQDAEYDSSDDTDEADTEEDTEEDTEAADESTDELGDAVQELANALDGTLWVGMNPDYDCYALGFNGTYVYFAANDGSSIEGYWAISDQNLYIYSDEANTQQLAEIPWSYDSENSVLVLNNNAVMAQTDSYSFDQAAEAVQQMAAACKVGEYLQGTYWATVGEGSAEALHITDSTLEAVTGESDGSASTSEFIWGIDYNNIYLYDSDYALQGALDWQISDDGSALQLTTPDGIASIYTQLTEEEADDVVNYMLSLIGG